MSTMFKKTGNKGIVMLSGDLTLPYAEELKGVFLKALVETDDVSVGFENVQEVDLSCLQLLCSAHRSAVRLKKSITFNTALPQAFKEAADAAGFTRLKGCKLDCDKSCLWMAAAGA